MQNTTYQTAALSDLLAPNPYPGRGIIIGKSPDGKNAVFAYFIMGRSENSRNRVFTCCPDGSLRTEAADPSKLKDPSLIIYAPVRPLKTCDGWVVTNGDQTDTVVDGMTNGLSFAAALRSREFEPDAPNWTPRISGYLQFDGGYTYAMSILKSADSAGTACNRFTYEYAPLNGIGHFLHTYAGDGDPLPTFTGEPERVYIPKDIDEMTDMLWNHLNEENKISLVVRYISLEGNGPRHFEQRIHNKYHKA